MGRGKGGKLEPEILARKIWKTHLYKTHANHSKTSIYLKVLEWVMKLMMIAAKTPVFIKIVGLL